MNVKTWRSGRHRRSDPHRGICDADGTQMFMIVMMKYE